MAMPQDMVARYEKSRCSCKYMRNYIPYLKFSLDIDNKMFFFKKCKSEQMALARSDMQVEGGCMVLDIF